MTIPRFASALAAAALCAGMLTACAPDPEPTPEPLFASEEEAFAAAEDVYRAYIEASNRWKRNQVGANPEDFLVSTALTEHLDAIDFFQSEGLTSLGETLVHSFVGFDATLESPPATVAAIVCLDVSGTTLIDEQGRDITPQDRARLGALAVTFIEHDERFLISRSLLNEDHEC